MQLDDRNLSSSNYRFGFNGKENDPEVAGQQDYGFRIYDRNLARFKSVDPLTKSYPELTTYQFASNRPISAIDLDGGEAKDLYRELEPVRAHVAEMRKKGIVQPETKQEKYLRYFITGGLGSIVTAPIVAALPLISTDAIIYQTAKAAIVIQGNAEAIAGVGGLAASIIDPNPTNDYPGNLDDLARVAKVSISNIKTSKILEKKITNLSISILNNNAFRKSFEAFKKGKVSEIVIDKIKIVFDPDIKSSGISLFGENGFAIGIDVLKNQKEIVKTVIHELFRLHTTNSKSIGVGGELISYETKETAKFVEQVFKKVDKKVNK